MAILFIADRRSWRVLNLVGFVATFGVASAWGALKYTPDHYANAQLFLALFLLICVFTAVFYTRNTSTHIGLNASGAVDSTLVFGTPLAGFAIQAGLVQSFELGTALPALVFWGALPGAGDGASAVQNRPLRAAGGMLHRAGCRFCNGGGAAGAERSAHF